MKRSMMLGLICAAKKQYGSWAGAQAAAKRTRRHLGEHVEPYLCKHGCGMFHVGHSNDGFKREEVNKHRARVFAGNQPRHDSGTNPLEGALNG